jgi:hypothetical protein
MTQEDFRLIEAACSTDLSTLTIAQLKGRAKLLRAKLLIAEGLKLLKQSADR